MCIFQALYINLKIPERFRAAFIGCMKTDWGLPSQGAPLKLYRASLHLSFTPNSLSSTSGLCRTPRQHTEVLGAATLLGQSTSAVVATDAPQVQPLGLSPGLWAAQSDLASLQGTLGVMSWAVSPSTLVQRVLYMVKWICDLSSSKGDVPSTPADTKPQDSSF